MRTSRRAFCSTPGAACRPGVAVFFPPSLRYARCIRWEEGGRGRWERGKRAGMASFPLTGSKNRSPFPTRGDSAQTGSAKGRTSRTPIFALPDEGEVVSQPTRRALPRLFGYAPLPRGCVHRLLPRLARDRGGGRGGSPAVTPPLCAASAPRKVPLGEEGGKDAHEEDPVEDARTADAHHLTA